MPEQKGIMLGIMTPQGPIFVGFSIEGFTSFVETMNTILDNTKKEIPIPKAFEDAFKKEENDVNTD